MFDLFEFIKGSVTSTILTLTSFLLGLALLGTALNIFPGGWKFGPLLIPAPSSQRARNIYLIGSVGLVLIGLVLAVYFVEYKPSFKEVSIYSGKDAKQITVDGEDVYVLKENGNLLNISEGNTRVVDDTDTDQVVPAGGLLYLLKQNGQVWTYQPVSGGAAQESSPANLFDQGTHTSQIIAVGETLYVLKESGNVWRYFVLPPSESKKPNENERKNTNNNASEDPWKMIDPGTATQQIASSRMVLYILKKTGEIWQYAPSITKDFQKIYAGNDAVEIGADGGALYFIKNDGTTWKMKNRGLPVLIDKSNLAKSITVRNGFVYMLTADHKIFRRGPESNRWAEIEKAKNNNWKMAAFGPDLFVIKDDKSVVRYSEYILRR